MAAGAHRDSRLTRIGHAVLNVLLERGLESIPTYGTVVVTGYKLLDAVIKEFGAEQDREQLKAEILASVRSLTLAEIEQDVDQAMKSPAGQTATGSVSPQQLEDIRRQLLRLPTEIDRLLAEIEIQEHEAARVTAARAREEREEQLKSLRATMQTCLQNGDLKNAHIRAEEILAIDPKDAEAQKVESFTFQRVGMVGQEEGCLITWLLTGAALFVCMAITTYGSQQEWAAENAWIIVAVAGATALVAWKGSKVWHRIPRPIRKPAAAVLTAIIVIYLLAAIVMGNG